MWQAPARLRLDLLALLSADPAKPATISYDELLEWADEDTLAEWVDGRVVMASPASARRQYLAIFLSTVLQYWRQRLSRGYQARRAPPPSGVYADD